MSDKLLQNDPENDEKDAVSTILTSWIARQAWLVLIANVSRQRSNPRRRKGTAQGPRGIQARDRRAIRREILHHVGRRQGCTDISLRGMGADRAEAGRALQFQSDEEKVPHPYELLR